MLTQRIPNAKSRLECIEGALYCSGEWFRKCFFVQENADRDIDITDSRCLDKGRIKKYTVV